MCLAYAGGIVIELLLRCRMLEQELTEQATSAEQSKQGMEEANTGLVKQLVWRFALITCCCIISTAALVLPDGRPLKLLAGRVSSLKLTDSMGPS